MRPSGNIFAIGKCGRYDRGGGIYHTPNDNGGFCAGNAFVRQKAELTVREASVHVFKLVGGGNVALKVCGNIGVVGKIGNAKLVYASDAERLHNELVKKH